MMEPIENQRLITCRECQTGKMHRRFVTYVTWLDQELITVPDFPAWVCDACGVRVFDGQALNRLSLLLSPNAGHSTLRPRPIIFKPQRKKSQPTQPK